MNKKISITIFSNISKFAVMIVSIMVVAVLLSPIVGNKSNNTETIALPQKATMISSDQQSSSSTDSNGNNIPIQTNSGNAVAASSVGGGNSSSSSTTGNLNSDINSMIGNLDINKVVKSTVSSSTNINKTLSGKIAGSQVNLKSGNVERVLFGDWSLDAKRTTDAKFTAKFAVRASTEGSNQPNSASSKLIIIGSYSLDNLKVNSVQQQNNDMTLGGSIDVSARGSKAMQSWKGVPVAITITNQNAVIVISFDKSSAVTNVFQNLPILGVVVTSSRST